MNSKVNVLKKKIISRMDSSVQELESCHCPIIGADYNLNPYLIGTGVVLYIESKIFIVTAAHVFDENSLTTMYTFLDGNTLKLEGDIQMTSNIDNERTNDKIDIAIFKVNDNLISKFCSNYKVVKINDIKVNDFPMSKKFYSFIGYPKNKTKRKVGTTKITREIFSYTGLVSNNEVYENLEMSPNFHLVVDFNQRDCVSPENTKKCIFPSPIGMSGGGVWLIEDFNKHFSESSVNKLVGIAIENHSKYKVMVGVRIGAVVEILKRMIQEPHILPKTNFNIET